MVRTLLLRKQTMEDVFLKFHRICGSIEVFAGSHSEKSTGTYFICDEKVVGVSASKNPVWKLRGQDRYIFTNGSENGWRIGDKESLTVGDFYYKSKTSYHVQNFDVFK